MRLIALVLLVAAVGAAVGADEEQEREYFVMIDAGSSGTRSNVFSFARDAESQVSGLRQEWFEDFKPGLSHAMEDKALAMGKLAEAVQYAQTKIPKDHHASTELHVMATAGMRLLPHDDQDRIMEEAYLMVSDSGFRTSREWLTVESGEAEATAGWVSQLLQRGAPADKLVALDLGGASTQIAFATDEEHATHSAELADGQALPVFAHSRLGYGMTEAWKAFLDWSAEGFLPRETIRSPCLLQAQREVSPSGTHVVGDGGPVAECFAKTRLFVMTRETKRRLAGEVTATPLIPRSPTVLGVDNFAKYSVILMQAASILVDDEDSPVFASCQALNHTIQDAESMHLRVQRSHWMQAAKCLENAGVDDVLGAVPDAPVDKVERLLFGAAYMHALLETYGVPSLTWIEVAREFEGHDQNWALGAAAMRLGSHVVRPVPAADKHSEL